ncbi:MAG: hypothetical protein DRG32_04700 [Deltaproteobacteria bacterium]|nr:MAG: hypothetical protein DRG32_04700 [Deltaproteobacteria bacterium]
MVITLLTDFGWQDGYVGAMKGVILRIAPETRIVDLAHEIPPHDITAAALVLRGTYRYFPEGSIHVVVVDPGVGGKRRPLLIATERYRFVGPDNGVFTFVLREEQGVRAYELRERRYFLPQVSSTFHGRDIFAPVAAHLALGEEPSRMGPPVPTEDLVQLPIPEPQRRGEAVLGEVIYVDRFGNLVTNISAQTLRGLGEDLILEIDEVEVGIRKAYEEGKKGEVIALWGSWGLLELATKGESLREMEGWGKGKKVTVRRRG